MTIPDDKLQQLVDRAEISDLIYRYIMGVEARDQSMMVSVFSDDAFLDYEFTTMQGKSEIEEFFAGKLKPGTVVPLANRLDKRIASTPLIANIMYEINGDQAHTESRGLVMHYGERGGRKVGIARSLRFSDDHVKRDGVWKISRRFHPHPAWMVELDGEIADI